MGVARQVQTYSSSTILVLKQQGAQNFEPRPTTSSHEENVDLQKLESKIMQVVLKESEESAEADVDPSKDYDQMLALGKELSLEAAFEECLDAREFSHMQQNSWGVQVLLLQFDRYSEKLEEILLGSAPAQKAARLGCNLRPSWGNGAKNFVNGLEPVHLGGILPCDKLRPWHVLIPKEDEDAVYESIQELPYRFRKLKAGIGRSLLADLDLVVSCSSDAIDDSCISVNSCEIVVKHTFVHAQEKRGARICNQSAP